MTAFYLARIKDSSALFPSLVIYCLIFHILIFSRTTGPNWTLNVILIGWSSFKIVSGDLALHRSKMAAIASDLLNYWKSLKIFFRTAGWNESKFCPNILWVVPSKIVCVDPINDSRWPSWLIMHLLVLQQVADTWFH